MLKCYDNSVYAPVSYTHLQGLARESPVRGGGGYLAEHYVCGYGVQPRAEPAPGAGAGIYSVGKYLGGPGRPLVNIGQAVSVVGGFVYNISCLLYTSRCV